MTCSSSIPKAELRTGSSPIHLQVAFREPKAGFRGWDVDLL